VIIVDATIYKQYGWLNDGDGSTAQMSWPGKGGIITAELKNSHALELSDELFVIAAFDVAVEEQSTESTAVRVRKRSTCFCGEVLITK